MHTDCRGVEIKKGSLITYPGRTGSVLYVRTSQVQDVASNGVIVRAQHSGRDVLLRNTHLATVVAQ